METCRSLRIRGTGCPISESSLRPPLRGNCSHPGNFTITSPPWKISLGNLPKRSVPTSFTPSYVPNFVGTWIYMRIHSQRRGYSWSLQLRISGRQFSRKTIRGVRRIRPGPPANRRRSPADTRGPKRIPRRLRRRGPLSKSLRARPQRIKIRLQRPEGFCGVTIASRTRIYVTSVQSWRIPRSRLARPRLRPSTPIRRKIEREKRKRRSKPCQAFAAGTIPYGRDR